MKNILFAKGFVFISLMLQGSSHAILSEKVPTVLDEKEKISLQKASCEASNKTSIDYVEATVLPDSDRRSTLTAVVNCIPDAKLAGFDVRRKSICDNFKGEWSCYNGYLDILAVIAGRKVTVSAEENILDVSLAAIQYISTSRKLSRYLKPEDKENVTCDVRLSRENVLDIQCKEIKGIYLKYKQTQNKYRFNLIKEYDIFL